ncbi:hypothetical protein KPH14_003543 [Odynerus spinipes]|uniref:Afadin n=1 Tax=Odynerus spinipes TaxID=1348599 RepID=A0AAD9RD00_9HYME|nr:hypothetical protein KPH14_003543 [Odynerus spinipes]
MIVVPSGKGSFPRFQRSLVCTLLLAEHANDTCRIAYAVKRMATEIANKRAEREALRGVIQQWNANRLDLFELSEPNEDLEFHGVMRFYFQDSGQKVATKCIRVASDATSRAVIETLIEKFRPDMRMLSVPEYALYEIHENGDERKLGLEEKPLLVQLNWHVDDREGRFLLRRIDDKTNAQGVGFSSEGSSFRRKLSKREKKQMRKQEKLGRLKSLEQDENAVPVDQNGVAEKLYTELPETSFTRSISNPEAVMRRRRQQKLERKLQQFRSKDGGPDTGGTLKIYGEALCKDVPYKTLLLSVRDSAAQVVREMLSKYGLDKVDPQQYCLVQVNNDNTSGGTHQEYILDDDECPLAILMNHPSTRGSIMFHVRRRPADYVPRKRKKKPSGKWNELDHRYEDERLPFLLELNPDGTDIPNGAGVRYRLQPNVTEVGSERPFGPQGVQSQTLTLSGPTVMPRHCVIAFTENIVTLTPCSRDAHTFVNNQRIHQTTILQNGAIIKFGRMHTFRFIDPAPDDRIRQRHDSNRQIEYAYDRRSPDATSQEANSDKYRSGSGSPNGGHAQSPGQTSNPPSPTKSTAASTSRSPTHGTHAPEVTHNYETTFDLDGNVETASLTSSRDGNRHQQYDNQPRGTDPILPAVLEFLEDTEEAFLRAVITDVDPSAPQFKLAPTYTLYLAARYRASTHYRPELQPTERAHRLTVMLANIALMIQGVIQERYMDASSLAFWLANGSELLHMLKSDRHVGAFSTRAQDILADAVHAAFASLVHCVSLELTPAMSQFMADADEPAKEAGVLQIFSNTMALLRRCRVNAALTIQLFSHLFHAINAIAFNALVSNGNLCVRWFGRRLKARLNALETWAERQGLELASQCHLATIMQATHLLQAPKYNAEELATLSSTCFKLNSLQVRALLQKYQPAADEPRLPAELIENVVRVAESVADTLARADGREIRLEEESTLALALLLPEDGYSCEVIRGVPPGLVEFLAPLQQEGFCRMAPQPTSSGYWTIYMIDHHTNLRSPSAMSNRSGGYTGHVGQNQGQPEIHIIKLHKSTNGMGLSIVAAKGAGQDRLGIYIKSVVAGGAADADGRLAAGDQLLKVDGQSLVGITQEKAAEYLVRTGPTVTLEVAKQGAIYHGLATLLSQPSPIMTRAHKARPKSEHIKPPARPPEVSVPPSTSHSMGNLLSVPLQGAPQERYVGWDVEQPTLPGATASQLPKTNLYLNEFERRSLSPSPSYPLTQNPQNHWIRDHFLDARSPVFPVGEFSDRFNEERNWHTLSSTIPVVQESDGIRLSVPCHFRRQCNHEIKSSFEFPDVTVQSPCEHRDDSMSGLTFRQSNGNEDHAIRDHWTCPIHSDNYMRRSSSIPFGEESFDSIPYIDQTDDNYLDAYKESRENAECKNRDEERKVSSDTQQDDLSNQKSHNSPFSFSTGCSKNAHAHELGARVEITGVISKQCTVCSCSLNSRKSTESRTSNIDDSPKLSASSSKKLSSNDVESNSDNDEENYSNVFTDTTDQNDEQDLSTSELITKDDEILTPELILDLSGVNDDAVSSDTSSTGKFWKSPDEVRLGCGRVATLAKHFSALGDGGLIKMKSMKLTRSRQFASEPDIASPRSSTTEVRKSVNTKMFKSESDLCYEDKSTQVSPERQSSIDIHDTTSILEENRKDSDKDNAVDTMIRNRQTKLSLAEQRHIIEQIKEFSNLDNTDAPLCLPQESRITEDSTENSEKSSKSLNKSQSGSSASLAVEETLKKCRTSSSSNTESSNNYSSSQYEVKRKKRGACKLARCCSLKELSSSDNLKQEGINFAPALRKYFVFPARSNRVISAPDISKKATAMLYLRLIKHHHDNDGNFTVHGTLSIGKKEEKRKESLPNTLFDSNSNSSLSRSSKLSFSWENLQSEKSGIRHRARRQTPLLHGRRLSKSHQEIPKKSGSCQDDSFFTKLACRSCSMSASSQQRESKDDLNNARINIEGNFYVGSTCRTKSRSAFSIGQDSLSIVRKSKSDPNISRSKPSSKTRKEKQDTRVFPSLEIDSVSRPRRMSERDLSSRLGRETIPQQIHSSKSVPALHNMGAEGKQQHEIFNPGYSRASSSNSVTPPVQPSPMPAMNGASCLRSRSSHNLHDPTRIGALPPTGLVSRQQSSPNLNPNQTHGSFQNNLQNNEAERFYQNLSVYRNQDPTVKQQQQQSLSQQHIDDRNTLHTQRSSRGSQNSLNRPPTQELNQGRDRPISAHIPQTQQQGYSGNQMQHQNVVPPRSQSSRDIIRQEAKLQEMQEEVRRRELRGGAPMINQYRPNTYNMRPANANQTAGIVPARSLASRPLGSTPNLATTSATRQMGPAYSHPEAPYAQYGQCNKHPATSMNQYGMTSKGKAEPARHVPLDQPGKESLAVQETARSHFEHNRQYMTSQNGSHYTHGPPDLRNDQYSNENTTAVQESVEGNNFNAAEAPPVRPALPEDGYRESPPPPPPNTLTHPLYNNQADSRYNASMQDPPRGGYYPASGTGTMQQPRQYQYSANNPWQREEREKEQARRREAARQWRDQQIAELSALPHRTPQQDEQLRALQLERDFQKRAEEAANQQDEDDECNDIDTESIPQTQGLLSVASPQERTPTVNQQHTLSRANVNNQSIRGTPPTSQTVTSPLSPNVANSTLVQNDNSGLMYMQQQQQQQQQQHQQQHQHPNQSQNNTVPLTSPTSYSSSLSHIGNIQKTYATSISQNNEERETQQRRIEEIRRKEFDENQRQREEESRHQQQQQQQQQQHIQQLYKQQQQHMQHYRNQQALHPNMLRLDNLIINGPNTSPSLQNGNSDAPPPPERGSSYAVMSQQSALRSNSSTSSNIALTSLTSSTIKRVSFHDPNANTETTPRNVMSGNLNTSSSMSMVTIREDPNNFINDAENLLASPKSPEGPGIPFVNATPGVIGAQEVYKDPRQKRLAEKQKQQNLQMLGAVPEKLSFKEKMKMFAMETGEDGTPRDKVKISRAQREIDNIGGPLSPNNNTTKG